MSLLNKKKHLGLPKKNTFFFVSQILHSLPRNFWDSFDPSLKARGQHCWPNIALENSVDEAHNNVKQNWQQMQSNRAVKTQKSVVQKFYSYIQHKTRGIHLVSP